MALHTSAGEHPAVVSKYSWAASSPTCRHNVRLEVPCGTYSVIPSLKQRKAKKQLPYFVSSAMMGAQDSLGQGSVVIDA